MAPESDNPQRMPWLPVDEGASQGASAEPDALTPTKPPIPAWIKPEAVPQEVEGEEATVIAPVEVPAAEELLPSPGVETTESGGFDSEPVGHHDAVQMLGDSAIASAALSAGGAPTPLGGVPIVPAADAVSAPEFADGSPAFAPRFVDGEPEPELEPELEPTRAERADALAAGIIEEEQAQLAARASALDAGTAYAPRTFEVAQVEEPDAAEGEASEDLDDAADPAGAADSDGAADTNSSADTNSAAAVAASAAFAAAEGTDADAAPAPDGSDEPPSEPPAAPPSEGKKKWWLWVVIALVGIAAGLGAFALLYEPEPIVNEGTTVTLPPPVPSVTPIAAPTATDFQAAMPTTVGMYSLVEAVALDPTDVALGAGRIADGVDLTYDNGADTMQVRAFQYYTEEEAQEMAAHFAGDPETTEPVEVGGVVVGESAPITDPSPGIVWRNGTSVFVLTGPASELDGFYAQFGL